MFYHQLLKDQVDDLGLNEYVLWVNMWLGKSVVVATIMGTIGKHVRMQFQLGMLIELMSNVFISEKYVTFIYHVCHQLCALCIMFKLILNISN